jgi:methionyl aminopeptidase
LHWRADARAKAIDDDGMRLRAIAQACRESVVDIVCAVETTVRAVGTMCCITIRGISREMHEDPGIPNSLSIRVGDRRMPAPGMTLAIEPMVVAGSGEPIVLDDGWTVVSADGTLSAHFEHTIAITNGNAEILTRL